MLVGIVGPCGAGKSTLVESLKQHHINARQIAQEHSYVKDMWQRLTNPDVLIYLDASYPVATFRRNLNWTYEEYQIQIERLQHAKEHANLFVQTDKLSPNEVLEQVMRFLEDSSRADLVK